MSEEEGRRRGYGEQENQKYRAKGKKARGRGSIREISNSGPYLSTPLRCAQDDKEEDVGETLNQVQGDKGSV